MKSIFDSVSKECSKAVNNAYSTSFSLATKMLSDSIRQDIYKIYAESFQGPDHLQRIQEEARQIVDDVFQAAGAAGMTGQP